MSDTRLCKGNVSGFERAMTHDCTEGAKAHRCGAVHVFLPRGLRDREGIAEQGGRRAPDEDMHVGRCLREPGALTVRDLP